MIVEIDTATADEAVLRRMYEIRRACHLAVSPDDPFEDAATGISTLRFPPAGMISRHAVVGAPAVAFAGLHLPADVGTGFLRVCVEPGHRRRGLGTALLAAAAGWARAAGRTVLTGVYGDADGAAFTAARGARPGHAVVRSLLRLPALLAPEPVPGYRAVSWTGHTPDVLLASYAQARNAILDAPSDDGVQWPHWTPQAVRDQEQTLARRGLRQRVTAILDHDGAVVAYTQILALPEPSELAGTDDTAVVPAHRRRGLASWAKAESLRLLAVERPDVTMVNTSNAAENTGMLAVNRALGFRPVATWTSVVYDLAG